VVRRGDDDGFGQVDGDFAGTANFEQYQRASAGAPWLRNPMPPWQRWGSTERITIPFVSTAQRAASVTLSRVSYRRPDTFHFLFGAKLIVAPSPAVGDHATIDAAFNVLVGVGSTVLRIPVFERFVFDWIGPAAPPVEVLLWSTEVNAPPRNNGFTTPNTCSELVGQDITIEAVCTNFFGPTDAVLEVTSFLAPKNHIRPDWFVDGPPEQRFAGSETEGR
jgi:hypothetical protein